MIRDHLTVDAVADHLEGLLGDAAAVDADRHLAACAECAVIRADLVVVRDVLAAAPADPMPATVVTRIEVALASAWDDLDTARAAVSATRADVAATRADVAAAQTRADLAAADLDPKSRTPVRPRRRRFAPIFAAAGTIGIVVAAAVILPSLGGLQSGDDDDAGGAAVTAQDTREEQDSPASAAEEPDVDAAPGEIAGEDGRTLSAPITVTRSGRNYTAYTLSQGVSDMLASNDLAGQDDGGAPDDPETLASVDPSLEPFAAGGSRVRDCIRELASQDLDPILVDLGSYGGEPAVIIVLPDPADPDKAIAWAARPECGTGGSNLAYDMVPTAHPTAVPAN